MTHMSHIICVKELVTYSRFLAASKSFPWSNIDVVIAIKTIGFSIIDELIFTDVSLKIIEFIFGEKSERFRVQNR